MRDDALEVVEAMDKYGGGFVKALAQCIRRADCQNEDRLRLAFRDYWQKYRDLAEKDKAKSERSTT